MKEILELAKVLQDYIILFCPGYLTIYMYFFFCGRKIKDTQWLLAKAICLSYLYLNIIRDDLHICLEGIKLYIPKTILLLVFGIMTGILASKFRDSEYYDKMLKKIKANRSYGRSEFDIISNQDNSVWICVMLKDESNVYEGSLYAEELDDDVRKYIILCGYRKYTIKPNGKKKYLENYEKKNERMIVIYYNDIKLIEKVK